MRTVALCFNGASAMPNPMPELPPITRTRASLSFEVHFDGWEEAIWKRLNVAEERLCSGYGKSIFRDLKLGGGERIYIVNVLDSLWT